MTSQPLDIYVCTGCTGEELLRTLDDTFGDGAYKGCLVRLQEVGCLGYCSRKDRVDVRLPDGRVFRYGKLASTPPATDVSSLTAGQLEVLVQHRPQF